jgi:hypothetical protein
VSNQCTEHSSPAGDEIDDVKDSFYEEFECEFGQLLQGIGTCI